MLLLATPLSEKKGLTFFQIYLLSFTEADSEGVADGAPPPPPVFFAITCFFNHFEELQNMLFEVELIINNALLIYVYTNTIEICLTPNRLLHKYYGNMLNT